MFRVIALRGGSRSISRIDNLTLPAIGCQQVIWHKRKGKNHMLDLDEIKAALRDRRLDMVSEATGLHRNTIAGIRSGKVANPSYEAVKALSDYFGGVKS